MINNKNYYKVLFSIFFLTYFSINVANFYVITFIPFYFLEVINVNRSSLAFTKLLTSVPLLLPIVTGYLYDRYSINIKRLNIIFSFFFTISFLVFLIDPQNLALYGVFYVINLISQFVIRGGMTKIFMEHTKTNKQYYSESIKDFRVRIKNKFLLILNIGSILGSTFTAIVSIFISDLRNYSDWNVFFLFGFIFSIPILVSSILLQKMKIPCIESCNNLPRIKLKREDEIIHLKGLPKFVPIILLYVCFFMTDPSLVIMLYMSWFSGRFGDEFVRISFLFFPISYILMMSGNLLVVRFLNKYKKRKNLELWFFSIGIASRVMVVLLLVLLQSPIMVFLLYFVFLPTLGPIETLSKASMSQKISQEGKHPTLRMQFLSTAYPLASMVLSPIGLILSTLVPVDYIILISLGLNSSSIVAFILSSRVQIMNKSKKLKNLNVKFIEKIEEVKETKYVY